MALSSRCLEQPHSPLLPAPVQMTLDTTDLELEPVLLSTNALVLGPPHTAHRCPGTDQGTRLPGVSSKPCVFSVDYCSSSFLFKLLRVFYFIIILVSKYGGHSSD